MWLPPRALLRRPWFGFALCSLGALLLGSGCSSSDEPANAVDSGSGGTTSGGLPGSSGGDSNGLDPGLDPGTGAAGSSGTPRGPWALPDGFTAGTYGGFLLGPSVTSADGETPELPDDAPGVDGADCGTTILGIVRDFRDDHPDFEHPDHCCDLFTGIVEDEIGSDQKPIYAHEGATQATTGPENFDQWYRTVSDVNLPYWVYINLEPNGDVYTFHSDEFFPLDGEGWGNQGRSHNYHFTTEIHTKFRYRGGEVFRFTGDDDVFVFINGHLVIDLGGVHAARSAEVVLDDAAEELGLTIGESYNLDLFHAERRTVLSNFRIDTTLELVDCGYVVPDIVVR